MITSTMNLKVKMKTNETETVIIDFNEYSDNDEDVYLNELDEEYLAELSDESCSECSGEDAHDHDANLLAPSGDM